MRPKLVERAVDTEIAALAARQHGVVTTEQLASQGLGRRGVSHRAAAGRLHRVHRGVYAVGHPILTANGHRMAAVLACGPGAALSHASAAALWEIRRTAATRIDVSVPGAGGRTKRARIRVHRAATLASDEVTEREGIRVTTPARTLLDLAAQLPRRALERALDEAVTRELFDLTALTAVISAHANGHGAGALSRALAEHRPGTTPTKSTLEELMLAICDAQRLVVEADSYRYHHTRTAFDRDRERDAILARAGYRVLRFSDRQLSGDAVAVAETIRSSA